MKRVLLGLALLFALPNAPAVAADASSLGQNPTVEALLKALDQNMTFDTRSSTLRMIVTKNGRGKTYEMKSFARGADEAAMEFLSPARDAGTRMLKKGGELWMYLPSVEKTQRISGHMLRQGMMGSDFSYEDLLEAADLFSRYKATLVGREDKNGRPCYKVEMTALKEDISYPKRVSWIDAEHLVPVNEELYALSGVLLKVIAMDQVKDFGGRKFPTHIVAEDKLAAGSKTEVFFDSLDWSIKLEEEVFSMRWLER